MIQNIQKKFKILAKQKLIFLKRGLARVSKHYLNIIIIITFKKNCYHSSQQINKLMGFNFI
jgi:hypothetical protein